MPRYLVERDFDNGLGLPITQEGAVTVREIISNNTDCGVTWVESYVSEDKRKTYCIYDGPNPEAIRRAAECNGLPIVKISRVSVLDPYFYF